jgi:hypothetical protein
MNAHHRPLYVLAAHLSNLTLSFRRFGLSALSTAALFLCAFHPASAASLSESFDGPTLLDWQSVSRTENPSGINWRLVPAIVDNDETHLIDPHGGTAMATVGFESVASGAGVISEWLLSPVIYGLRAASSG